MVMTMATEQPWGQTPTWSPAPPKLPPLAIGLAWLASGAALFAAAWVVPGATINDFWVTTRGSR